MKNILWGQISTIMFKRLFILLTIIALSLSGKAKNLPTLKVTNITANGVNNFPDTIYGGITYSYLITVTNTDTSLTFFNDTSFIAGLFTIKAQLADTSLPEFTLFSDSNFFQILPGDSITFQLTDSFGTGLKLGNNVVVVWPSKVGSGITSFIIDSTYYNIYFIGSTGINEIPIAELRIYPNPFGENISIDNPAESKFRVFIYDAEGRIVYQNPLDRKSFDLSFLKSGAYLVEVRNSSKVLSRKKIIKR